MVHFYLTLLLGMVSCRGIDPVALPTMTKMLDDMEVYFGGPDSRYDRVYLEKLAKCFRAYDDVLLEISQEHAWSGMLSYWKSNGTSSDSRGREDHWGECDPKDSWCSQTLYLRHTPGYFGEEEMKIYEPCNYVSNVAYYRSVTRICDYPEWSTSSTYQRAMKRNFATLAIGSAFWHGSYTSVGLEFDNRQIAMIAYIGHQISVSNLPDSGKPWILRELSLTPRNQTSLFLTDEFTRMFITKPVSEWAQILDSGDYPGNYEATFAAMTSSGAALLFPDFVSTKLVTWLSEKLLNT